MVEDRKSRSTAVFNEKCRVHRWFELGDKSDDANQGLLERSAERKHAAIYPHKADSTASTAF